MSSPHCFWRKEADANVQLCRGLGPSDAAPPRVNRYDIATFFPIDVAGFL
jgi:hypothetical protein